MATIVKRHSKTKGTTFQVKVRLKGYPLATASFTRKTDAEKWASKTETEMRDGRYFRTNESKKHTVTNMIERYLEHVKWNNPKRLTDVQPKLEWWKAQIGHTILADVNKAQIAEAREKLQRNPNRAGELISNATVNRYMTALSHAFTIAVNEWEWLEHHPMRKLSNLKEPRGRVRYLSDKERGVLLNACQSSKNPYLYLIVVLALSTGARRGEILNLRWQDIDFKRRMIVLHETKNDERRVLPLAAHALELMASHQKVRRIDTDFVFPSQRGEEPIEIKSAWYYALKQAELEDFRFHDLRHSAASYLAMNGATLAEIAEVLGHKTLAMVKRYSHLSESHVSGVVASMNQRIFG